MYDNKNFRAQFQMLRRVLMFVVWMVLSSCAIAQQNFTLSLDRAPTTAALVGTGTLSTAINERDFALSPDGKELYYTISTPKSAFQTIVVCKRIKENVWSAPQVVPFAGMYSDLEPAFSADGNTLYFSSNRPVSGNEPKDFDIWKVTRQGTGWSKPENLGQPINTLADEFYPSIAKSGSLYFTATYAAGVGKEDIYVSTLGPEGYQTPVALDTAINTKYYEFNAFVSPDEKYLLFTSYGRKDDRGGGDLYMSVKDENNVWKPAINLRELNSPQLDYCPSISPDGKRLFFTSERHQLASSYLKKSVSYQAIIDTWSQPQNGNGNLYWVDFQTLLKAK